MRGRRVLGTIGVALLLAALTANVPARRATAAALTGATVAVIGDYGVDSTAESNVATMVAGWSPDAVVTVGDNYYTSSAATGTDRYDLVVGKYYCAFLKGAATGPNCAGGTAAGGVNRFFPATGNHDYSDGGISNYTSYFALPSNERYYSQVVGDVEFFFVDSEACLNLVGASTEVATEKAWLQSALAASTTAWQVVVFHHPPYSSSSTHGSSTGMRWDFSTWGADLVLSGHDHTYERLSAGGLTYVVNGLGGAGTYAFGTPLTESLVRYNENWGALKLVSSPTALTGSFYAIGVADPIDTFSVSSFGPRPAAFAKSSPSRNAKQVSRTPTLTWGASTGATNGYEYCFDATVNSACDGSWVATSSTSASPTLLSKKTYEWQVRALNASGETYANGGTWWKFTTVR